MEPAPIPCIVCDKTFQNFAEEGGNQPNDGLAFMSYGHYGTTVFDPMDGSYLEINVCDDCLKAAKAKQAVLLGWPKPSPPSLLTAWQ